MVLGGIGDGGFPVSGPVGGVVAMAVAGASMGLVYLGILWLTRNPELRALVTPIAARLRGIRRN